MRLIVTTPLEKAVVIAYLALFGASGTWGLLVGVPYLLLGMVLVPDPNQSIRKKPPEESTAIWTHVYWALWWPWLFRHPERMPGSDQNKNQRK